MMSWEQDAARLAEAGKVFDRYARDLQMEVLHDDGLYRHLRFAGPGLLYELVTWPGELAVTGDGTALVFRREADMFGFFGRDRSRISPSYWAEKCIAGHEGITEYDPARARRLAIESLSERARYGGVPKGTGKALREQVLDAEEFEHEEGARMLLRGFEHGESFIAGCRSHPCRTREPMPDDVTARQWVREHEASHPGHLATVMREPTFTFSDVWEWDLTSWTHRYLHVCHAIPWGIGKYWAHKNLPPRLWTKWGR